MNLLKNSQTNWKYILIVIVLTAIVGEGISWFSTKQKVSIKFAEIKKPEKNLEEVKEELCEKLSDVVEKDECYLDLAKTDKDPKFCEMIKWGVIKDRCKKSFEIKVRLLKLSEEKGPIPLNIVNSDKELKRYLIDNLLVMIDVNGELQDRVSDLYEFFTIHFLRGNLDEDPFREIVIVFESGSGPAGSGIIKEKEDGFYITYWDESEWRVYEKKLSDLQMIKNQPRFIILEIYTHPGTGMWYKDISILRLEKSEGLFENEFKRIWKGLSLSVDDQPGMYKHRTEINTEFRDLNGDGNLEIIREGYTKSEEKFNEETGEFEEIKEEKIYQILKWDEQKQSFIEETLK